MEFEAIFWNVELEEAVELIFVQYAHCELNDLCLECLILSFGA